MFDMLNRLDDTGVDTTPAIFQPITNDEVEEIVTAFSIGIKPARVEGRINRLYEVLYTVPIKKGWISPDKEKPLRAGIVHGDNPLDYVLKPDSDCSLAPSQLIKMFFIYFVNTVIAPLEKDKDYTPAEITHLHRTKRHEYLNIVIALAEKCFSRYVGRKIQSFQMALKALYVYDGLLMATKNEDFLLRFLAAYTRKSERFFAFNPDVNLINLDDFAFARFMEMGLYTPAGVESALKIKLVDRLGTKVFDTEEMNHQFELMGFGWKDSVENAIAACDRIFSEANTQVENRSIES